jgi:hypothetical protein
MGTAPTTGREAMGIAAKFGMALLSGIVGLSLIGLMAGIVFLVSGLFGH